MPHAIADSDDDGDENDIFVDDGGSAASISGSNEANAESALHERSTGSTGNLGNL